MGLGTRRALLATLLGLLVAALSAGCGATPGPALKTRAVTPAYVALGDSYSSGAGMDQVQLRAGQCAQSRLSYPFLVATALDADLVDMSCGNATTETGTTPQKRPDGTSWPPQLDALTAKTELVTVGIGLNDFGLFNDMLQGCASVAATDPDGSPCASDPRTADWVDLPAQIGTRVAAYLADVKSRAPAAQVVLVGYPQVVPASGTCAELPLAAGDYAFVRDLFAAVDTAQRQAAQSVGVTFVEVQQASAGHDICAGDDAWINGATAQPAVAAAYHPYASYQDAVARLVLAALA